MASLNEVQLIGNTGIDPDIKQTSNGNKYAIFTFATTDKRKDAPDTTQWHKVVCWDERLADTIERFVKKGDRLYIKGKLVYRTFEHEGVEKEKAEVHMEKFSSKLVMLGGNAPKKVSMITSKEQTRPSDTEEKTEEKVYRTFEDEVPY
tara:strand:+ start:2598 stop:3041 length:444 start_codon:yes stop_codon:yes gene_type:complete